MSSALAPVHLLGQRCEVSITDVAQADASCHAGWLHAHDRPVGVVVLYEAMAPIS